GIGSALAKAAKLVAGIV
uniref:Caerulein precursor fragment-related peptide BM2 n=2 Tax=Xenopus TaxID=262014 RepID=CRBM2_XENBM|nr:RecName: Full=Caerulein precursor fragment-related peptide BM2; AltName: Full=CPF-RP-BM2 [Xenopus boumbaensis]C0HKN5.1 RecName: Full=Caerulein precursor fragment-related peptide R3; AltName: Full=CPF-RP-R3 [Xenopus ruwenzoriensis]